MSDEGFSPQLVGGDTERKGERGVPLPVWTAELSTWCACRYT